jgi:hypothetical protein
VKEHNVSLRPETLKILPKVKSNWSLKCFSDREEDGYKLLVKDIKKVLKGSAKSVEMDAGKPKPQPGGHHRLGEPVPYQSFG